MDACYDLKRCPPSYDVVAFLANLEVERLQRGEDSVSLHILPGLHEGFRKDSLWPHTTQERVDLRANVLVPLCQLLPSVSIIEVCSARQPYNHMWGFEGYMISLKYILQALRAGARPLRPLAGSNPSPRLVTFTLREAEHHPLRNSRTEEWVTAAQELTRRGYTVKVLRDTLRAGEPLSGVDTATEASRVLAQRAALYSSAALNVGISNGPMWMAIFMDVPTLMLRPTTNAAGGCYDDAFFTRVGLTPGSQLPTTPPHQRLAWEEDTTDNIIRGVERMLM